MTILPLPQNATPANFDLFPFAHDFVLDGVPKTFTRFNGRLVPAVGAEVITSHGIGFIERATGNNTVIVRVVDFFSAPVKLQSGEVSHEAYVARLSEAFNNNILLEASWITQRYGDTKANRAKCDALLGLLLDDDQYEVRVSDDIIESASKFSYTTAVAPKLRDRVKTRQELKAERKALEAQASAALDWFDGLETPAGIADELEECFGE